MEPQKKRRKRREERVEGNAFMDTARSAFVRWVALEKWREVEDLRITLGFDLNRALDEAGRFPGRGRYESLWVARWKAKLSPEMAGSDPGSLFGAIEGAVAAALEDEEAERKSSGDRPLDEDPEYKAFIDSALESLLRAQAGQLERS